MRKLILAISILTSMSLNAQKAIEKYSALPFGSIKPEGWLKEQMQNDLDGFVGHLDELVPDLINDSIYGSERLQKNTKLKDLGNKKDGDAPGDEQYKWWNSETQSNWWDGYIRNVFLVNDAKGIEKVHAYVKSILATQDTSGYIGIYDQEMRYQFNAENGELWSKATLFRGLLAYYEVTKEEKVWIALKRAVENVIRNYPINASSPFSSGTSFNAGVSHGLTFTDVLERMYLFTKEEKYRDYAVFLFNDFSNTYQSEADAQMKNILNPEYKLKSHGVHTFEHLRALIIARYASQNPEMANALDIYLKRLKEATTISGGAIGDEWIAERNAHPTNTGYEYCSLQELLDSYCLLLQKSGNAEIGDLVENTFFNAAQGARNPNHSGIAYLKTDNSFEMMGTKNGEIEPDRNQTRYKYSPAHQDVAVCCSPNAGRISPYFVQNAWMKENERTLVAVLLIPNKLETTVSNSKISIENQTEYPNRSDFYFKINLDKPTRFALKIRIPSWVKHIKTNEKYTIVDDYILIDRNFEMNDKVQLEFIADVVIKQVDTESYYFSYGALIYANALEATEIKGKEYANGFADFTYQPKKLTKFRCSKKTKVHYRDGFIIATLINLDTNKKEKVKLIPMGKTILRQVTF